MELYRCPNCQHWRCPNCEDNSRQTIRHCAMSEHDLQEKSRATTPDANAAIPRRKNHTRNLLTFQSGHPQRKRETMRSQTDSPGLMSCAASGKHDRIIPAVTIENTKRTIAPADRRLTNKACGFPILNS